MKAPKFPNLVGEMRKHGETQQDLANLIGTTLRTAQYKLYGDSDFTISEMTTICSHYGKSYDELFG